MSCQDVEDKSLAPSYLAGELSTHDAEAFEQHYLGCDRCWSDVRTASELRAALGKPAVVPAQEQARSSTWSLLAAAAVVAFAAVGVWQITRQSPTSTPSRVLRGGAMDQLSVTAAPLPGGKLELRWSAHDEAQMYRVEVLRSDGLPAWKRATRQTRMILDSKSLPPIPPGMSLLTRVDVLDAMGQVVARSAMTQLPVVSSGN